MLYPSKSRMNLLCQNHFADMLIYQASAVFILLTMLLFATFCLPLILALPVGLVTGKSFWSEDPTAITAWLQAALFYAFLTAVILTALSCFARVWMHSHFGRPFAEKCLSLDLSAIEALKLVRRELRFEGLAKALEVDAKRGRIIALIKKEKTFRTFMDISFVEEDEEHCTVLIQTASEPFGKPALLSAFFCDLGESNNICRSMQDLLNPYSSRKRKARAVKKLASDYSNVCDMSSVNPEEMVPPPGLVLINK